MEKRLKVPKPFRPLFWYLQGEETSPYRYYALSGGRSSGKSTTAAISILLRCSMTCTAWPIRASVSWKRLSIQTTAGTGIDPLITSGSNGYPSRDRLPATEA